MALPKRKPDDTQLGALQIAADALDLPAEERAEFIAAAADSNPAVIAEVNELLAADAALNGFFEAPIHTKIASLGAPKDPLELAHGDSLGPYRILRLLGKGGFASVYLAVDQELSREVALKVIRFDAPSSEARTLAHMEHDHIVKIFSEGSEAQNQVRFLSMQYVPGTTLEHVIRTLRAKKDRAANGRTVLDIIDGATGEVGLLHPAALRFREMMQSLDFVELVLWMGTRLGDALAHAHGQGILHLDVKPGNVLMSVYGRPMLTDFNVSLDRRVGEDAAYPFGGTLKYMPPEQKHVFEVPAAERPAAVALVDRRADLFALGRTLQEFLAAGQDTEGIDAPLAAENALVRSQVQQTLARCCAIDPAERFSSAGEASAAFAACLELRRVLGRMPIGGRLMALFQRHPLAAITSAGVLPQLCAIFLGILYNDVRIVSLLSPLQKMYFDRLNYVFSPFVFSVGFFLWFGALVPLHRFFVAEMAGFVTPEQRQKARQRAIRLPQVGLMVSCLGWVPSAVLYPGLLEAWAGPLPEGTAFHFLTSCSLSAVIAIAYTYLAHQYLVLRVLYPRLCLGTLELQRTAAKELRPSVRWLAVGKLAIFVPLGAALLLIPSTPPGTESDRMQSFRYVLVALIMLGMGGASLASALRHQLERLYVTLTGRGTDELRLDDKK